MIATHLVYLSSDIRYDLFDTNKHGTRCAGQVSAQANNSVCSVGIAFNAGIGKTDRDNQICFNYNF